MTDAVSWILRQMGLETLSGQAYQVCNYSDDLGGVEATGDRAWAAFNMLAWLLEGLGLQESKKKAVPPSTTITYLGVQVNSLTMEMSVPPDKLTELKAEIAKWLRKSTISKRELQSNLDPQTQPIRQYCVAHLPEDRGMRNSSCHPYIGIGNPQHCWN